MRFSEIPGHALVKEKLIRSVKENRVSHAQLFTGVEGAGALPLAIAYARYVSCEEKEEADSCKSCRSCIKYERLIHPDLHFVFPVVKGKSTTDPVSDNYIKEFRELFVKKPFFRLSDWFETIEVGNAQGMIYASEASEIIRKLNLKTFESDFKVMIIWLPEKMHQATSNKLLKMIEEPPDKTLFLLVSENPDKIIPTILSRCQSLKIPSFSLNEISSYLITVHGTDQKKADEAASVSGGNIGLAIALASNGNVIQHHLDNFRNLMRLGYKKDVTGLIGWAENITSGGREEQKDFLLYALRITRENWVINASGKESSLSNLSGDEKSFSDNFHPFINTRNIEAVTSEFNLAHAQVEANGNSKIIFTDLALKMVGLIKL